MGYSDDSKHGRVVFFKKWLKKKVFARDRNLKNQNFKN